MNREIKFRVWDNKLSQMTMVNHIMFSETAYTPERVTADLKDEMGSKQLNGLIDAGKRPAFELMQYTGLKDKNGVEIWEGDILTYMSCPDKHFFCTCERKPNPDFTDTVVFRDGAFVCPSLERSIDQYTIIGNIYENKELLNDNL